MSLLDDLLPASGETWTTARIIEADAKPLCRHLMDWYRTRVKTGPVPKADAQMEKFDAKLLPHLSILELQDDGEFRFRLFGTARAQYYGEDLTGKRLRDAQTGEDKEFVHRLYRAVLSEGRPALTHTHYYIDRSPIAYDRVMIPLSNAAGTAKWVLITIQPVIAPSRKTVVEFTRSLRRA